MRRKALILLLGPVLLTLVIAGCGGGGDDDGDGDADGGEVAKPTPTAAAAVTGGGGGDAEVATLVQEKEPSEFYSQSCSGCHGQDRQGIAGLGLPLIPEALTEADEFYFDTIKNGRAGTVMPSWSAAGLTDPEIRAMIAFIRTAP